MPAGYERGQRTWPSAINACAVLSVRGVDCWGDNKTGGLGDGTTTNSSTPVAVARCGRDRKLSGVASLASEHGHASYCAVLTSGGVDCWGTTTGELGNGTTILIPPVDSRSSRSVRAGPERLTGVGSGSESGSG